MMRLLTYKAFPVMLGRQQAGRRASDARHRRAEAACGTGGGASLHRA